MNTTNIINKVKNPFLYQLDYLNIQSLSSNFAKLKFKNKKFQFKKKVKISVISDYTTNYLSECLPLFFANKKINVNILEKEYGALNFLSKDLKNNFWNKSNDFYLLIPSSKNLNLPMVDNNPSDIKKKANVDANIWLRLWNKIDKKIIQTTFEPTFYPSLGNVDAVRYGGYLHYIRLVNSILFENKPENVFLIDIENLVFRNEKANWSDTRMFNLAKQPFSMDTIPILSNYISNAVSGMMGMSKKVIVVDLDNTIWGGIVGDQGFNNIDLGPNNAVGEAFQNFQIYLKQLTKKGIILCVCSKNDEKIAKEAFLKNKNMILKLEDISIFKSNYLDKSTNIKEISNKLNLGLDSFVFVDDSKFECEMVKKNIPEVLTINLPKDPSNFIKLVDETSAFYFNNITKEDFRRKESYKNILKVNSEIKKNKNIDDFLKSIKSKVIIEKINKSNKERSANLLAKTNQFKLNSKLFSSKELLNKNSFCIFYEDKYQKYGNIGVVVYKVKKNQYLLIENWVMSCRVFSRRIEYLIFKLLLKKAQKTNCKSIIFKFEKTKKNLYLQEFLKSLKIRIIKKIEKLRFDLSQFNQTKFKNFIKLIENYNSK